MNLLETNVLVTASLGELAELADAYIERSGDDFDDLILFKTHSAADDSIEFCFFCYGLNAEELGNVNILSNEPNNLTAVSFELARLQITGDRIFATTTAANRPFVPIRFVKSVCDQIYTDYYLGRHDAYRLNGATDFSEFKSVYSAIRHIEIAPGLTEPARITELRNREQQADQPRPPGMSRHI
jgi:hypothetical protein